MAQLDVETLESFASRLVEATGAPTSIADNVAASLVAADLAGHNSHGVHRLAMYTDLIDDEVLFPDATPTVDMQSRGCAGIDGQRAYGQIVGRTAVETGTDIAEEFGMAVVGIRDATHLGRIGEWAERTAEADFLFAAFVNTQAHGRTVAPPGSADRRLATNPIAFGIPTYDALEFPIVHDMATSQVAHGKIRERVPTGDPVPDDWTVDDEGVPVRDAKAFEEGAGALLPLGGQESGYKGFGLAVIAELFAGIIGNAPVYGQNPPDPFSNAAAFVFVDPTMFTSAEAVEDRVEALGAYLRESTISTAVSSGIASRSDDEILLPGEAEYRATQKARQDGVEIADGILNELSDLARRFGIPDAIPETINV